MSTSDDYLNKLLKELCEKVNYLIADRNLLLKENKYLRSLFCLDETEAPPSIAECDERWNKIITELNFLKEKDKEWIRKYQEWGTYK